MGLQNNINPQNVYGTYQQTLFLGCSVMSFACNAGWGQQTSQISVQLVTDTDISTTGKVYYDGNLDQQTTNVADPGFIGLTQNIIGVPVYFRVADFEYAGLVQSWTENNAESGKPTYQVEIVDPRQILEGAQLIVGEYADGVGTAYNAFNVFGYSEAFGIACPETSFNINNALYQLGDFGADGAVFGTPAGGFGGAGVNDNGMQWSQILTATSILTSSAPAAANMWSPYGRIVFKGSFLDGNGLLGFDRTDVLGPFQNHSGYLSDYFVDLSEIPTPPSYWRMSGTNVTLMETISQVCDDAGYDFYIELVVTQSPGLSPSGIAKIIKVRTASRNLQPDLDQIDTFIGNSDGTLSTASGNELRNEPTTKVVIGGEKQTVYQIYQSDDPESDGQPNPAELDDVIIPYFGLDSSLNVIIPTKDAQGYWQFSVETTDLKASLQSAAVIAAMGDTITLGEIEMMSALASKDSWRTWIGTGHTNGTRTDTGVALDYKSQMDAIRAWLEGVGNKGQARDNAHLRNNFVLGLDDDKQLDGDLIFDWVRQFATEYYGRQFQVRVPYTCGQQDSESDLITTSENPSDGGWSDQPNILDLAHPGTLTDFFALDDNRTGNFVRYDEASTMDLSKVDANDMFTVDATDKMYTKCDVETEYVYTDKTNLTYPRIVLSVSQSINVKGADNLQETIQGLIIFLRVAGAKAGAAQPVIDAQVIAAEGILKDGVAGVAQFWGVINQMRMPEAVAIGMRSNIQRYGPWIAEGPAGMTTFELDDGLVPWEYGDFATMNLAGNSKADEGTTQMQTGETGTIVVPGYPTIPLGAELGSVAGGVFGAGTNLLENRIASSTNYFATHAVNGSTSIDYAGVTYGGWTGLYGPNVTSISVQVGPGGVQTSYTMRTYTPKFGRFARGNAERLRRMGQRTITAQKAARQLMLENFKRKLVKRAEGDKRLEDRQLPEDGPANTPHECWVGNISNWGSADEYKRTIVCDHSMPDLVAEMRGGYENKAFMSYDGLMRPISMDGDGGLPRYTTYSALIPSLENAGSNRGSQPPIYNNDAASITYNIDISLAYLNPFANQAGYLRSDLSARCDNYTGHDMEILGRSSITADTGTLVMPANGWADEDETTYENDYRMFGVRGPIMMPGWGYDLNGKPIPNAADNETDASGGDFVSTSLEDKFLDKWLRKPHTWPVGPVDLRWDRDRSVWTIPQHRLLVATLDGDLAVGGSAQALLSTGDSETLYNADGSTITAPEFTVNDKVGNALSSGTDIIAYYDPLKHSYYVLESPSSGISGVYATCNNDCVTGCVTSGTDKTFHHLHVGKGLAAVQTGNGDKISLGLSMTVGGLTGIAEVGLLGDLSATRSGACGVAISGAGVVYSWGKVQGSPTNQAGTTSLTVSVKECDIDGTNVIGTAFNVLTPLRANKDTALFADYVVGLVPDQNNVKTIVTDCFDDPIGSIRLVNVDSGIRAGWRLCDNVATTNLRGKFVAGFDSTDADYNAIGDTGGNADHGADTNDHNDHAAFTHCHTAVCQRAADINNDGTQDDFWGWVTGETAQTTDSRDLGHTTTDNRPPFFTLKYIERFE